MTRYEANEGWNRALVFFFSPFSFSEEGEGGVGGGRGEEVFVFSYV